jgi:hypothetical protein
MGIILYHYNTAFPIKTVCSRIKKNKGITIGTGVFVKG